MPAWVISIVSFCFEHCNNTAQFINTFSASCLHRCALAQPGRACKSLCGAGSPVWFGQSLTNDHLRCLDDSRRMRSTQKPFRFNFRTSSWAHEPQADNRSQKAKKANTANTANLQNQPEATREKRNEEKKRQKTPETTKATRAKQETQKPKNKALNRPINQTLKEAQSNLPYLIVQKDACGLGDMELILTRATLRSATQQ